jgi:acetyl esterase/lipase
MLSQRDELDSGRIVFLGFGAGGQAGAVALANGAPFVGAVLASAASVGPLFPDLYVHRIQAVLAPAYEWDGRQLARYRENSVDTWQEWLFEGEDQVSLLRRRINVRNLEELSDTDMTVALSDVSVPLLLLHGGRDVWTPTSGAQELEQRLRANGQPVQLALYAELDRDLGMDTGDGSLAPEVSDTILEWLAQFQSS